MAEELFAVTPSQEGPLSFSQESLPLSQQSLPLSQETFKLLLNELPQGLHSVENPDSIMMDSTSAGEGISTVKLEPEFQSSSFSNGQLNEGYVMEMSHPEQYVLQNDLQVLNDKNVSSTFYAPSSIPASQNWPGCHGFSISFPPQMKITKGVSWTYSKMKDKLYVGKDVSCPVNFIIDKTVPPDVILRATALYSSPEHTSENVYRCMDHSMEELQRGVVEASHLVRCESKGARYLVDPSTKRLSVVVPFENPPVGQYYSTYIYKFACFGSCNGGPGRRPLMVVFTLERGNEVIGRHKLDVKICACPGRDQKIEEGDQNIEGKPIRSKKRSITEKDVPEHTKRMHLAPTKSKATQNREGPFIITADTQECYEFLKHMKRFFKISTVMKSLPSNVRRAVMQYPRRSSYV